MEPLRPQPPLAVAPSPPPLTAPLPQIHTIATSAVTVARDLRAVDAAFRDGWDATWVGQLGETCRAMKAGALASGRPFILHRVLPDALFVWWQQQTSVRHIDTITKTAWDAARARHGRFNYSNATAVLRAEYTFAITLHAIGGLSSLERMHEVLIALGMLAEDYHRCAQRDATVGLAICPAIRMFVKRALPLILTCTSWLGAGITGA